MSAPRPGGPEPLDLRVAGHPVRIALGPGHEALAAELARLWAHLADPRSEGEAPPPTTGSEEEPAAPIVLAYSLPAPSGEEPPVDERAGGPRPLSPGPTAAYTVSGDLTRAIIERRIGRELLLHAGVLDHPRLGVVVLVGPSGAGKSTATATLAAAGRYLSDELAILDPETFAVTGYPKPVSRIDRSAPGAPKRDLRPAGQGLAPEEGAEAPALVVLLDRQDDGEAGEAGEAAVGARGIERVPMAEALAALTAQSSSLWRLSGALAALARLLDAVGGVLRVRYREAAELEDLLADPPPRRHESWQELPVPVPATADPGTVALTAEQQALALDDGVLLLGPGRSVLLDGVTAAVWDALAARGALDPAAVEEELVAAMGPHPRSAEFVGAALDQLCAGGWARRG